MASPTRVIALAVLCLGAAVWAQTAAPLSIVEDTLLPPFDAGVEVHIPLHARGGLPPYRWRIASGDLPDGISLTPDGTLNGRPAKPGVYIVTVTVDDSAQPAHSISKEFHAQVTGSLTFDWGRPPQVHGERMDGTLQVSNGSKDDYDLTVIVVAVDENGRATALGYQHFVLKSGITNLVIPFGLNMPPGSYRVHADAIAEITAKNSILRRQLETPAPLPVTQGP